PSSPAWSRIFMARAAVGSPISISSLRESISGDILDPLDLLQDFPESALHRIDVEHQGPVVAYRHNGVAVAYRVTPVLDEDSRLVGVSVLPGLPPLYGGSELLKVAGQVDPRLGLALDGPFPGVNVAQVGSG